MTPFFIVGDCPMHFKTFSIPGPSGTKHQEKLQALQQRIKKKKSYPLPDMEL